MSEADLVPRIAIVSEKHRAVTGTPPVARSSSQPIVREVSGAVSLVENQLVFL